MSTLKITAHTLSGNEVKHKASPNKSGKFKAGEMDTIIIHYTGGSSAQSSVDSLCNPTSKASAHLVIGMDGSVHQLVPFDTIAWHAGTSQYNGRTGFNRYSIGIELDNPGRLTKTEGSYISWFGRKYDAANVIKGIHRNETTESYWHAFTEIQLLKTEEICRLLMAEYNIKHILGHEEISPGRKSDPGPAFPLDLFRNKLLYSQRSENTAEKVAAGSQLKVVTGGLNMRKGPGTEHEPVTQPLAAGTKLTELERKGKWVRVKLEIEGWVHRDYVK